MADSRIQIKLERHLVDRARAWAENELGSMSPSASVAFVLREVMPMLERQARFRALDDAEEIAMEERERAETAMEERGVDVHLDERDRRLDVMVEEAAEADDGGS